jgi:hypothetical protein
MERTLFAGGLGVFAACALWWLFSADGNTSGIGCAIGAVGGLACCGASSLFAVSEGEDAGVPGGFLVAGARLAPPDEEFDSDGAHAAEDGDDDEEPVA